MTHSSIGPPEYRPACRGYSFRLEDSVAQEIAFDARFASATTDFGPALDHGASEDVELRLECLRQGGSALVPQWAQRRPKYGVRR